MTQPSRPSPGIEGTAAEPQGPADQTIPRAGTVAGGPPEASAAPDFAPPEHAGEVGRLGRYRVLKELGRGGMGAVYLGYDSALDRKVALKVMLPGAAANRDARERFLREARVAAKVKSDHVVTIHDVGEERGIPFIAMEYLLGYPLDQFLKQKGELPLAHVLRVGRETATGLAAAHALGLVHRDIKPGNLWLEAPKGRVKLLDFGLARVQNGDVQLTHSGAVMGTPAYMSPEQGRGLKVDHRSDLFSLGVMLYRLATGKLPFVGDSVMAILTSLAVDTPTPVRELNPGVPSELEAVIDRLLAKNPADRFQSAKEVADALRDIDHHKPAAGPLPTVVPLPVQSLVVGAQTQNVWEGIADSGSVPVPLATNAETEPESPSAPVTAPKPQRKRPERKVSLWPALAASVGLLAAVAVLAVVLWPKKENEPVAQNNEPNEQRPPTQRGKQPPAAPDPDRKAAEYVLSIGGSVKVNGDGKEIKAAADLPKDRFTLTIVHLASNKNVTDAGLVHLKDCKSLALLRLDSTLVTGLGLVYLKDCANLNELWLDVTQVGDAGLAHLKDHNNLTILGLSGTQVTDAGLAYLKDCKDLSVLNLSDSQVSNTGLAHLKDHKSLTVLNLANTQVGDVGLANFTDCKRLGQLSLANTQVGDVGLSHLKDCKELNWLDISNTNVGNTGLVGQHSRGAG